MAKFKWIVTAAAFAAASFAQAVLGQSMPSAAAPPHAKAFVVPSLHLPAEAPATPIRLTAPEAASVDAVKRTNTGSALKRLQVGIARDVPPEAPVRSTALQWVPVDGGWAARWTVTSAQARALRVAIAASRTVPSLQVRFAGSGSEAIYGPFTASDLASSQDPYWSPVLEGDTAAIEIFVGAGDSPADVAIAVAGVSHLIASPSDPNLEKLLKAASGSCEVNVVCRAASDGALASASASVARMTFTDTGNTYLCTGTLLNSGGGFAPYFYSANHCINTQAVASTLTTHWFYESTTCGFDTLSPSYVQLPGGAALLYSSDANDASFMQLNRPAPAGAVFSGWDATAIGGGTPLTGIHHPGGDLKKVSLGTMGGYTTPSELGKSIPFIQVNWNGTSTGVTEGGSSGSGIFTFSGSDYRFRGGELGGPSSCTASGSDLFDWYSRFDLVYPQIAQYLKAATVNNYTSLWWNPSEPGWGINVNQQGDIAFATLFTYDPSGNPMWLVMSDGIRQGGGDTFTGDLFRAAGPAFNASPFTPLSAGDLTRVGAMTLSFSGANSGVLSYSINGTAVTKNIQPQVFGARAALCQGTTASRSGANNYQDLWWNPAESGWGLNVTQQGDVIFATLFTYDANGRGMWLVMSAGRLQGDGSYVGDLFSTTGSPFNAQPFNGASVNRVGSMRLLFRDGNSGTLDYTVNGTAVTKSITRQVFSSPVPICVS